MASKIPLHTCAVTGDASCGGVHRLLLATTAVTVVAGPGVSTTVKVCVLLGRPAMTVTGAASVTL